MFEMRCLRAINNLSHKNGSTHHFARNKVIINIFFSQVKVVKSDRPVLNSAKRCFCLTVSVLSQERNHISNV